MVEYADWLGPGPFESITEVGCGNGRFLRTIASKAQHVAGHDWALSGQLAELPPNVSVSRCDLLLDPVNPAALVCSADVLEHIGPDSIEQVVAKLHQAGRHNFHAMACYDDGHSHLTIMPPDAWLKLFRQVSDQYNLLAVDARRNNAETLVCIVTNFSG